MDHYPQKKGSASLPDLPAIEDFNRRMDEVSGLIMTASNRLKKAGCVRGATYGPLSWDERGGRWQIFASIDGHPATPLLSLPFEKRALLVAHLPGLMKAAQAAMVRWLSIEGDKR